MQLDVEITQPAHDRFVARVLVMPDLVVEGASRTEAIELIRDAIRMRRQAGVEIVQVNIDDDSPSGVSSWRRHAGAFPEDKLDQAMRAEIERYRRELDSDTAA
jgi:uncharacterized protein YoaH (UPF0181 family)